VREEWVNEKLGSLVHVQSGYAFKSEEYLDSGHFLIRIGNVQDGYLSQENPKFVKLTEKTQRFSLNAGDLLVSLTGNIGRVAQVEVSHLPAALNQRVARLTVVAKQALNPAYFFYFLSSASFQRALIAGGHGAAQQNVSPKAINDVPIPLPALPEQQRIVAVLDEAFAGLATATANAEKNLKNASELFDSYLNSIFASVKAECQNRPLGEVCSFVRGPFGGSLKKSIFVERGFAVYEQQHAIYDQFDDIRYFIDDAKFNEMKRFELKSGDLIMSCSGTMGRVAIAPTGIARGIINQALLKLTPSSEIKAAFLKYWMESENFQESLKSYSGGAAIQNVASVQVLKEIAIPLPSVDVQAKLVSKLDAIAGEKQRLKSNYSKKLNNLAQLKQSILQKAFSGELTSPPSQVIKEAAE
jgi:type I restriction enzyme, S subunit